MRTSLHDDDILDDGFCPTNSGRCVRVPDLVDGAALKDVYEAQRDVGEDEEEDQAVECFAPLLELGDAEEEHADGEFACHESYEDLYPVEVVVFQEAHVVDGFDVVAMTAETPEGFLHNEAHSDRVGHLDCRDTMVRHCHHWGIRGASMPPT